MESCEGGRQLSLSPLRLREANAGGDGKRRRENRPLVTSPFSALEMNQENIWTAASEGDAARVAELVESGQSTAPPAARAPPDPTPAGLSPSIPDENTYTPLHAAASYSHTDILRYLVSKGGDINTVDGDGETPLFLVETAETARVVVELGGDPRWKNVEGMTVRCSLSFSLWRRS